MRVMLDTNVLVSAIVFPNDRMDSLIFKASLDHQLVLSSYIVDELLRVTEKKFPSKVKDIDLFLTRLPYELVYTPKERKLDLFTIRDIDDYPVLYSAIVEDVDLLLPVMTILIMWRLKNQRLSLHRNFLQSIKNDKLNSFA